jgi:hypothetical protein
VFGFRNNPDFSPRGKVMCASVWRNGVKGLIMCSAMANVNQPHFLNGWKEIANYLGKGVRTAQRYERNFALPVRRPSGRSEGAVMATPAEIDAWLMGSTKREMLTPVAPRLTSESEEMTQNLERMKQSREVLATARTELRTTLSRLKQASLRVADVMQQISGSALADFLRSPIQPKLSLPLLVESIPALTSHKKAPARAGTKRTFAMSTRKVTTHRSGHLPSHGPAKKSA